MSTFVFFGNPHSSETGFFWLLLLEQVRKIDKETFHPESRDQMHNEDRTNSRRPGDVNDPFFRNRCFFLQLIDAISRALFLQFFLVWIVRVAAKICFLKFVKNYFRFSKITFAVIFAFSSSVWLFSKLTFASSNWAKPIKIIVGKQTKSSWKAQKRKCEIGENRLKQTFWQPGWFVSHLKFPWNGF